MDSMIRIDGGASEDTVNAILDILLIGHETRAEQATIRAALEALTNSASTQNTISNCHLVNNEADD